MNINNFVPIVAGFVLTAWFLFLVPNESLAQGSFTCIISHSGVVVIDENATNCEAGYSPIPEKCIPSRSNVTNGCIPGGECSFDCIDDDEVVTKQWGEICGNTNNGPFSNTTCSSSPSIGELTCRITKDGNEYRCLLAKESINPSASTVRDRACRDSSECNNFDDSNFPSYCVVTNLGQQPFCAFFNDQLSAQCSVGDIPTQCEPSSVSNYPVWDCSQSANCSDLTPGAQPETEPFKLCSQVPNPDLREACLACSGLESSSTQRDRQRIWTGFGCIETRPTGLVNSLLTIGLSLGGGVAFVLIIASGFMFTTSQGDPKRTSDARELASSAIIGLLFIIFSVAILQFIGVDILKIPGFGGE